jgi:hypothetical protein
LTPPPQSQIAAVTTENASTNAIAMSTVLATYSNKPCHKKVGVRKRKNNALPATPVVRPGGKKSKTNTPVVRPGGKKSKTNLSTAAAETILFNTCDHDDQSNYKQVIHSAYFKVDYLQKRDYAPKQCADCSTIFGSVGYKVGTKRPVHACTNAQNVFHPCVHAYCNKCYAKKILRACCYDQQEDERIIPTAV